MKKTAKTPGRVTELEPYDKRKVNLDRIKLDFTTRDLKKLFDPFIDLGRVRLFSWPIETLSPVKTIGKGRTNITLIRPHIFQTDAATPHAGLNMQLSPDRKPAVQMHFRPSAYGITATSAYVMTFKIQTSGPCTFNLAGSFGFVTNGGSRTVNGTTSVSIEFTNVPPNLDLFGFIEQTAGANWNWFSVEIRFPGLVFQRA